MLSQVQIILPDNVLGDSSDRDDFLKIDLIRTALPHMTPHEFVLNADYHRLVVSSMLPRPSKVDEQTTAFCGNDEVLLWNSTVA